MIIHYLKYVRQNILCYQDTKAEDATFCGVRVDDNG